MRRTTGRLYVRLVTEKDADRANALFHALPNSGREQLASDDVAAVRSAAPMLTELEQVWRRWSTTTSSPAVG
ncbi:hypothetical protein [Micromonospora sp. NPDC023814]|uniref:hypothetical protein n=1 Tax=Micromonospora sp. NPDC023814 TaxID=3154596 RepID=UPI0033FEB46B